MAEGDMKPRPVVGFPGYRVFPSGRVQSFRKNWVGGWKDLKPRPGRRGYLRVALRRDGRTHDRRVHRLVLEAFVGPCPDGMEACHYPDPDPANCRLENLRWDTHQGNTLDIDAAGRRPTGGRHYAAKLTAGDVERIRRDAGSTPIAALARAYGVHRRTIRKVIDGRSWVAARDPGR